jgi:hypothetical protein
MVELASSGISHSPAPVGGRRHHKSAKKVSARTIRKTLRRLGMRPKGRVVLKGGAEGMEGEMKAPEMKAADEMKAGRRRRGGRGFYGGRSASASMSSSTKGRKGRRSSKVSLKLPGLGKLPF